MHSQFRVGQIIRPLRDAEIFPRRKMTAWEAFKLIAVGLSRQVLVIICIPVIAYALLAGKTRLGNFTTWRLFPLVESFFVLFFWPVLRGQSTWSRWAKRRINQLEYRLNRTVEITEYDTQMEAERDALLAKVRDKERVINRQREYIRRLKGGRHG